MILLHTPKGGSGKSTLARELAVAFTLAGQRVGLVDLDPQGTTTGWYGRREAAEPVLLDGKGGTPDLAGAEAAGIDVLVVDTPPATPAFLPALIPQASAVLVPVRPSPDDLLAAAPIAASLAGHPAWAFVLAQAPTRSRLTMGAVRQLAALGRLAPVTVGFRADFPAAAIEGKAAVEFPSTKAAEEGTQLRAYVEQMMGGKPAGTGGKRGKTPR
ncbi:AAA family ATPase [Roseomonas sp. BN140053]|uniref:AAA family ATPase n=1 Tax=Roseomonas sp. BN140053 TaxID=3391898 RepID=UPI0039EA3EEF